MGYCYIHKKSKGEPTMILFVNFAPIEYVGGAERGIYEMFSDQLKKESCMILSVEEKISGLYGKFVLGQFFEDRSNGKLKLNNNNYKKIKLKDFLPFSKNWFQIRNIFLNSRVIYIKGDLQELLMCVYFGGFKILNRTIIGIRSPLYYPSPKKIFEYLHNIVYLSPFYMFLIKMGKTIHVLNKRDKLLLESGHNINKVRYIPLGIEVDKAGTYPKVKRDNSVLQIIFIGELLYRKGVDILIETVKKSPNNFIFNIVGKGPMSSDVIKTQLEYPNCKYYGYLDRQKLYKLINQCDIMFFPSRAEGFGAVILEAMKFGLKVVDTKEIQLNLPKYVETYPKNTDSDSFLPILNKLYKQKRNNLLNRERIRNYTQLNFSQQKIKFMLDSLFV